MAITKPILPPKKGYVEVEVNGKRTYRNIATGVLIENEVIEPTELELLRADVDYLLMMEEA